MTRIFLAGGEVKTLTNALIDNGAKNILYSFYYILTMNRQGFIYEKQLKHPEINWFLDSGAFTYFANYRTKPETLPPFEEYVQLYFKYINRFGRPYCRIAEPDLDITFDQITKEDVDGWREEMLKRWPDLPIAPVWHGTRGPEAWEKYCNDPRIRHLCMGSGHTDTGMLMRMTNMAHTKGKTVHGFAMTKMRIFDYVHFDSVDSTSWVLGQKFGTLYAWRGSKFVILPSDKKKDRKLFKRYFENIGCDPKRIVDDELDEVRKCNVISWVKLSEKLEEKARVRRNALYGIGEAKESGKDRGIVTRLFSGPKERE